MTDPTTRPTSANRRALTRHRAAIVAFVAANLALLALLPDTRAILGGEDAGTTFVFVAVSAVWFAAFMLFAITNDQLKTAEPQPPAVPAPITLEQWRTTRTPAAAPAPWSWTVTR